jgi:hypothetical protein
MNQMSTLAETRSAYTAMPQTRISEHYTGVGLFEPFFSPMATVGPRDPLGFSLVRLAAGEADVVAGRVKPLTEVLNALRAGDHPNSR